MNFFPLPRQFRTKPATTWNEEKSNGCVTSHTAHSGWAQDLGQRETGVAQGARRRKRNFAEKGMGKLYKIALYKNNLVEKIFPVSLEDTEASYRGTLTQALKLSTDNTFLNYTKKLAESN